MYRWISGYVRSVYRTIDVRRVSLCAFYGTVPPKHSIALCHRRRAAPTSSTPSYFARLFGAAPSDREGGGDAEPSDSSDDDQDRAAKAARATGSTTIPDVAVFQVLAFWLGDAKTL